MPKSKQVNKVLGAKHSGRDLKLLREWTKTALRSRCDKDVPRWCPGITVSVCCLVLVVHSGLVRKKEKKK